MEVLVHYTTQQSVYNVFNNAKCKINNNTHKDRFNAIDNYYNKYHLSQNNLFFVVNYYINKTKTKHVVGKILKKSEDVYEIVKITDEISTIVVNELGLNESTTYDSDIFYKVYYINDNENFCEKEIDLAEYKIKLKYFSWEELVKDKLPLHNSLLEILFDRENVLNVASTYSPSAINLNKKEEILNRMYISALKKIGFISNGEIIDRSVLHGDIGEFLMNVMIAKFFITDDENSYLYPKLAFKSSPNMAVYGNDGTFYNRKKREIYFCEAKFYTNLNEALSKAVDSLKSHEQIDYDFIESNINLFRKLSDNEIGEIVEIDDDVKEKQIIFLMCSDFYTIYDIKKTINNSKKLKDLRRLNEVYIFVLPILDKGEFLRLFELYSEQKRGLLL